MIVFVMREDEAKEEGEEEGHGEEKERIEESRSMIKPRRSIEHVYV